MDKDYPINQGQISVGISKNHRAYEEELLNELYKVAQRVKPEARNLLMDYKLLLSHDFSGDIDASEQRQIYNIKLEFLKALKKKEIIKNTPELTEEQQNFPDDFPHNLFFCLVSFYPEKLIMFVAEEKLKTVPIDFDFETGDFRVGKKIARFRRNTDQYKVIKFLYENPNKMHGYEEVATGAKLENEKSERTYDDIRIESETVRARKMGIDPELLMRASGMGRAKSARPLIKRKVNDIVDEIREKLEIKDSNDVFICNDGYMLKR